MSEFWIYLRIGLTHILDLNGYDHILFILALCSVYRFSEWKKLVWLITSFTLGHSITLILATFKLIELPNNLVELLIPVTILLTSLSNLNIGWGKQNYYAVRVDEYDWRRYGVAVIFGLIHGLGFSNYLQIILGKSQNIVNQLFAFNVGLEIGQIIVAALTLCLGYFFISTLRMQRRDWVWLLSGIVAGIALKLIFERWIF